MTTAWVVFSYIDRFYVINYNLSIIVTRAVNSIYQKTNFKKRLKS